MELLVFSLSHKTHSVSDREAWRVRDADIPRFLHGLSEIPEVSGACFLATCNRIELYLSAPLEMTAETVMAHWRSFCDGRCGDEAKIPVVRGPKVFQHLLRVSAGLESMVFGENEVFGQVKRAYQTALDQRVAGSLLNFTFQEAFRWGKTIRTETGIGRHPTSVSTVGLKLLEEIFGELCDRSGLVLGLGEMGRQTLKLLKDRGVHRLIVANRTFEKGKEFAEGNGMTAIHFEDRKYLLDQVDFVVTCTAAETPILTESDFADLKPRQNPLVLIDLGVPRDIAPALSPRPELFLYNIDDLRAIAEANTVARQKEAALAEELIQKALASFGEEWLKRTRFTVDLRARSSFG